ncbi:S41 family peptidase [Parapedobacter sp.]
MSTNHGKQRISLNGKSSVFHKYGKDKQKNLEGLSKIVGDHIGYITIPQMYHYNEVAGLENFIANTLRSFSNTKALIIDIRNNPGGSREVLQTFAGYIVRAKQSPWVANVAYLRTDKPMTGDEESMSSRYLYSYNSEKLSDNDRKAIDQFREGFNLQKAIDNSKFSGPFYMVLHQGKESYGQPVYILVNEESFSAASVFASAFKGLPNVKIVGETTDGSSGNSRILRLKNSNIQIRVSTMASFQRNGKTLDGNGTIPDRVIQVDEKQVLDGYDTQLTQLINIINRIQ